MPALFRFCAFALALLPALAFAAPVPPLPTAPSEDAALSCRAFGCRFDGTHHPLRDLDRLGSSDTHGWSAAQWQALFPGAGLDDEVDGLAVQAAIDAQAGRRTALVTLPPGQGFASRPIETCARSVVVNGAGASVTTLTMLPRIDGFRHCAGHEKDANVGTTAHYRGFTLTTLGAGATPFNLLFGYGNPDTNLVMEDIQLRGEDNSYATQFWGNCGAFANAGGAIFRGFKCSGVLNGPLGPTGEGLEFRTVGFRGAKSAPAFDLQFTDVNVSGYRTCAAFRSATDLGMEGVVFHGLQCGRTQLCLDIATAVPTYHPPQWQISQMECETAGGILRVAGAADLVLSDSLILVTPKGAGLDPAAYDLFSFTRVIDSAVHHTVVEAQAGSKFHAVFAFAGGNANLRLDDHLVRLRPGAVATSAGLDVPANLDNHGLRESGTVWVGWPTGTAKVFDASRDPNNVLDSAWAEGLRAEQVRALPAGNADRPAILCTDCRKPGEAEGRGTGMRVFDDGHAWVDMTGAPPHR